MNKTVAILLGILSACLFRIFIALQPDVSLFGFSPVMAMAFLGGSLWMGSRRIATASILCLFLTDLTLNSIHGYAGFHRFMLVTLGCYFFSFWIGNRAEKSSLGIQALSLLGSSITFYMITNTYVWFGSSHYPQNFAGWVQSWTIGLPGYQPTYTFLRNALISDFLFWGALKFGCQWFSSKSAASEQSVAA